MFRDPAYRPQVRRLQSFVLRLHFVKLYIHILFTSPAYLQAYNAQQLNVVPITSYQNEINADGSFQYGYVSGDGSQQQVNGFQKALGGGGGGATAETAQVVQGSYSYTSPDGTPITVTYIADENGE